MSRAQDRNWEKLSPAGAPTCQARYRRVDGKAEVHHCGHPTANWPYFIVHFASFDQRPIVGQGGHGFRTSAIAKTVADRIVAGELAPYEDGDAVVVNVNAYTGEVVR